MDPPDVRDGNTHPEVPSGNPTTISLQPFEELVGRFESIQVTEATTTIELSTGSLQFHTSSRAATICTSELEGHEGEVIGILRTTSAEHPVRIRFVEPDAPN